MRRHAPRLPSLTDRTRCRPRGRKVDFGTAARQSHECQDGDVTISWSCAFCDEPVEDDPRALEIGVAPADSQRPEQYFRAHFMCVRSALHATASAHLTDPLTEE